MLAAMIKTALVFFLVQSTGNLVLGAACWDERLSGTGRNSSCTQIQRSDLSGQMKMTVLKLEEQLEALSVDREDKRLFWVQLGLQGERAVASCDYSGNSLHIMDLPLQSRSLGISVFLENVYYTDAAAGVIRKINKYTGGQPVDVNAKPMVKPPVDIKVVHPIIQPMADTSSLFPGCSDQSGSCVNVCSRLEEQGVCQCSEGFTLSNHGTHCEEITPCGGTIKCGHGCIATEHGAMCVCPEGSVLQEDGHTCTGANVCLHLNGGCAQKCESDQGLPHCSCLPHFTLSADGKSCLSVSSSNVTAESGDETSNLTSLKNKTLHEESIIPLAGDNKTAGFISEGGTEPALFTEKMIADQNDCYSLHCAVSARCVLDAGNPVCLCLEGYTGDGQTCLALESTSPKVTSQTPMDVTTRHHNSNSAEKCPPSHDAYCLYHGVCVYFPELTIYACNCIRGYLGERCQFSDLEWLELQQAEKEKERNLVIGGCMVALISIISITACITYCFRSRRLVLKQTSEDNVSEISVTDESMSETTTTSVPRFSMVTENGVNKEAIHPDPRRTACSPCATETAIKPMSEQSASIFKHDKEYGNLKLPDATTETAQPAAIA
ncbi:hypothetical protein CCH79_00005533 [Gambusia affinis]|uniref:EGF-like domain-containing protein n=1 Tax=Gambusia affinis TaxID=33528 RepID=A0A315V6E5_GAMAF|nr:hypothetical protein CCH79_00005533 [Gambusia affinis]